MAVDIIRSHRDRCKGATNLLSRLSVKRSVTFPAAAASTTKVNYEGVLERDGTLYCHDRILAPFLWKS